jgi:hypothetical protein
MRVLGLFAGLIGSVGWSAEFQVTSAADAGAGSLRAAIDAANALPGRDRIGFVIPPGGLLRIALQQPLPPITDALEIIAPAAAQPDRLSVEIDGSAAAPGDGLDLRASAWIQGLAIVGFRRQTDGTLGRGIVEQTSSDSELVINQCFVGVRADGRSPAGNAGDGVVLRGRSFTVFWPTANPANLVSANGGRGIVIESRLPQSAGYAVQINRTRVGTSVDGNLDLGNAATGVWASSAQTILLDTELAANAGNGVEVRDQALVDVFNAGPFRDNLGLPIDLVAPGDPPGVATVNDVGDIDFGPNGLQNYPEYRALETVDADTVALRLAIDTDTNRGFSLRLFAATDCAANHWSPLEILIDSDHISTDETGQGLSYNLVRLADLRARPALRALVTPPASELSPCFVPQLAPDSIFSAGFENP